MSLVSRLCLPLRCSGVSACLWGSSAAPHPDAVRGVVEERPEGEREVWSLCFPDRSAEELHYEETGQYVPSVLRQIDQYWDVSCSSSSFCVVRVLKSKECGVSTTCFWVWTTLQKTTSRSETCCFSAFTVRFTLETMTWVERYGASVLFSLLCLCLSAVSLTMCVLSQGKRFLVFLFSWNVDFIWVIHGTIKNQLEFYSKWDARFILFVSSQFFSCSCCLLSNLSAQDHDQSYHGDLLQSMEEGQRGLPGADRELMHSGLYAERDLPP